MTQPQPWREIAPPRPAQALILGLLPSLPHHVASDEIQTKQKEKILTSTLPGHCHGLASCYTDGKGQQEQGVTWMMTSAPAVALTLINLCFPVCPVTGIPSERLEGVPTHHSPPSLLPCFTSCLTFYHLSLCLHIVLTPMDSLSGGAGGSQGIASGVGPCLLPYWKQDLVLVTTYARLAGSLASLSPIS